MQYTGSIKKRLIGIILLVTSLTGLLGYGSFLFWNLSQESSRVLEMATTVGKVIGQNAAKIILLQDVAAAAEITAHLKSFPNLKSLVLYNQKALPVYQYSLSDQSFPAPQLPAPADRATRVEGDTAWL